MTVFRMHVLPAEEGDCLVLVYGPTEHDLCYVVIDAGHTATQKPLKKLLTDLGVQKADLVIVTHVDADHIEGMLNLVGVYGPLKEPDDIWFNGYRHLVEDFEEFGPVQGETFTTALLSLNWNKATAGRAIRIQDDDKPSQLPDLKHGLKVTVLSPNRKKLQAMVGAWKSACAAAGLVPGQPADKTETREDLEAFGADLAAIAATSTARDSAKANGTSIALLVEYAGRTVVLGADAHPDVLSASLTQLGNGDRLKIDLFKLPHHGSQSNVTVDLLKAVECAHYVVSTNGKRFNHPDEIAMARVITSSPDQKRLWFNYRQPKTERWEDTDLEQQYSYTCRFPGSDGEPLNIDLLTLESVEIT